MSEAELSASEDGIFIAESSNQSSSPCKPSRGTTKRGRGRPKRNRRVSSDNDSSSNGLLVSSLKHVGKFRYLSNLTQTESAEAEAEPIEPTKPVATRGKRGNGRGRGRGRSSANQMISPVTNATEPSNHVSRSGRRIKPNNRWAPDADFDPGPGKSPSPVKISTRKTTTRAAKAIAEEKVTSQQNAKIKELGSKSKSPKIIEEESSHEGDSTIVEENAPKENQENGGDGKEIDVEVNPLQVSDSPESIEQINQQINEEEPTLETFVTETTIITTEVTEVVEEVIEIPIENQEVILDADTVVIEAFTETIDHSLSNAESPESTPDVPGENGCGVLEDSVSDQPFILATMDSASASNIGDSCNSELAVEVKEEECKKDLHQNDATDSHCSEQEDSSQGACGRDGIAEPVYNSSAGNTPRGDDEPCDSQSVLISPKPVKVKSRWRRTSELEQVGVRNGNSDQSSCNNSPMSMSPKANFSLPSSLDKKDEVIDERKRTVEIDHVAIIEERLKSFEIIEENLYLTNRNTSKEVKRMLCDCSLSKEEIARGELGCGEDCINRLLMIECGSRCQLSSRCTNKRFQKRQYGKIEVFNTEKKGIGLRALEDMEAGDFIIEYVGEVIDPREFHRRAKDYAREKNKHYYFMALKSDAIIDATQQGNISRFINHSCDPNAETQKWTVNGDLRVGFFTRKSLKSGDEITFDYQFQRYGKEAQRCYCESSNCRGWIGEDPEKEDKNRDKKEKRDRERRRRNAIRDEVNNIDLESEIERLIVSGVKNRAQTLNLSRLMVRAEDFDARRNILTVLRNSEQACRRLFLDYHGLKLLWGWMVDASSPSHNTENIQFKLDLLSTLTSLPVPNKTMLLDSKLISIVEKWASANNESQSTQETAKLDEATENEEPVENQTELNNQVVSMASQLLESWSSLKEVFRIPKKEQIEKMKEHEREADQECENPIPETDEAINKQSSYDRRPNNHHRIDFGFRDLKDKEKSKRLRESPDRESRKVPRLEIDNISKEERRRLFALKVAQQDEELRARRCQEDLWRRHIEQFLPIGVDQNMTPLNMESTPFIASASPGLSMGLPQVVWDPLLGQWQPCTDEVASSSVNLSALTPLSESSSTTLAKPSQYEPPLLHLVIPKGYNPTVMGPLIMDFDLCKHEASGIPFVPASLVVPLSNETTVENVCTTETKQPIVNATEKLPRFWRQAVDTRGRSYYYHVRLRLPQWEPPTPESETPEFSSDEEEEENEVGSSPPITETAIPTVIENPKEQERERRRNLLCHEKIISPRSEFERSDDAQRYRELKERVLRQKLVRIRERGGLWIEEAKSETKNRSREKEKRKMNDKEKEKEKMKRRAKEKYKRSLLKGENRKKVKEPKEISETPAVAEKDAEISVNGEGNDTGMEKDLMDGSLDDYMLMNFGEAEDEAGEQERNRDLSANTVRKIKDAFRMKISSVIVSILNPYRRPDCKLGRITCTDDFKHLARKMTHFVLAKELKHCRNIEDLVVNDSVKHKAKDFIKKYMVKFGPAYKRGNDDDA